jgi:hypothetical protein
MPLKDLESRKAYKRNWYLNKYHVTNPRAPQDGRSLDGKSYARDRYRAKAIEKNGYVHVRSLDDSPAARLEFRSFYTGDCIVWTGASNRLGYGSLSVGGRFFMAHRLSYELSKGPIPAGLEIDHLCRNPPCINPAHLEAVSHTENVRRGEARIVTIRLRAAQTHCKYGHEFSPENTMITKSNGKTQRVCRACRRARKNK